MSRLIESGTTDGVGFGNADETDAPLNVAGEFNLAGTLNLKQALKVSGTVFDESQTPVEDATVALLLQSGGTSVAYTTTDSNGKYEFIGHPDADGTQQLFHVAAYDDDAPINNAFSKPYVSAALNVYIGELNASSSFKGTPVINGVLSFESQYAGINSSSTPSFVQPVAYSNLIAWYPFDSVEYGGSDTDDVTAIAGGSGDDIAYDGFNNQLTHQPTDGVTDINAGANSGAYEGNQTTGLEIPALPLSNTWTMTAWGYFFNNNDETQHLIMVDASGWNDDVFLGYNADGNSISLGMAAVHQDSNNQVRTVADSQIDPDNNTWYHLAATSDGSVLRFYLDGVEEASASKQGNDLNWGSTTHLIGGHRITDRGLDGYVDDVRFYNTNLSGSQINQIYQNTQP